MRFLSKPSQLQLHFHLKAKVTEHTTVKWTIGKGCIIVVIDFVYICV